MSKSKQHRTVQVKISLTRSEADLLDGTRQGVPRGVAARAAMLDGLDHPGPWLARMMVQPSPESTTEIIRLRRELNAVGVNLNQLVRLGHTDSTALWDDPDLRLTISELLQVHKDIATALEVILDVDLQDADDEQG